MRPLPPLAAMIVVLSVAWLGLGPGEALAADAPAKADVYEALLTSKGIAADANGIGRYLRSVLPSEDDEKLAADLIRQLGSDEYSVREEATQKLLALPVLPEAALVRATQSADLEVSCRAEYVLKAGGAQSQLDQILAALRVIEAKALPGMVPLVLDVVGRFDHPRIYEAARDAVVATARPQDAERLRAALKDKRETVRATAVAGLPGALGKDGEQALAGLLEDPSARVRLGAARALADRGNRKCLPVLADLLGHDDIAVRADAITVLRALTGQNFGYAPYGEPDKRKLASVKWQDWVREHGESAELTFPLSKAIRELGRTVVLKHGMGMAVILDASGRELGQVKTGRSPWGVQVLPSGNLLVGCYGDRFIYEYGPDGNEVWKSPALDGGPMSVSMLPNGNILAALSDAQKVVEINRKGEVVWQAAVAGRPADAQRLPDGSTLVAAHQGGRVVEINKDGREVWAINGLHDPQRVQRLPNGNTLVALTLGNTVAEYDRKGKIVWSKDGFSIALDACRLPNGNTLVVDNRGVWEIAPSGQIVWKAEMEGLSRAWRY